MKERKYKEDFALKTYMDPHTGRERREAVYRGAYYSLALHASAKKRLIRQCALLCALFFLTLLTYLSLNTPSSFCMYVLPVLSCSLFPGLYWALGVFSLPRGPHNLTSVQKEKGPGRVSRSALGCAVLCAMAFIGDVIFIARGGGIQELRGLLLIGVSLALAATCFVLARRAYSGIITLPCAPLDEKEDEKQKEEEQKESEVTAHE